MNRFKAYWKQTGEEFDCKREGGDIAFGRGDEEKWRKMPTEEFWKFFKRDGAPAPQGGLFE